MKNMESGDIFSKIKANCKIMYIVFYRENF